MHADVHRPFTTISPLAYTWQPRGLDWLLLPNDVPQLGPVAPVAQAPRQPAQRPAPSRRVPGPRPERGAVAGPEVGQATGQPAQRAISGNLPPVWAERLAATRRGLIVWTYVDLGQDLLGVESDGLVARRAFLGQLLKDMNNPAGTHTFWPVTLPGGMPAQPDTPFTPNPDAFWSGMARLGARAVVAMGAGAVEALGLPEPLGFMQQTRYNGSLVLAVSDVGVLMENTGLYRSMLHFVRTFLATLIARAYPD